MSDNDHEYSEHCDSEDERREACHLKNRGLWYHLTEHNPLEKAFADQWEKENEECPGLNYGNGTLQGLFCETTILPDRFTAKSKLHEVSDSERYVAATVIQWLGTNCGQGFLLEALNRCGLTITKKK